MVLGQPDRAVRAADLLVDITAMSSPRPPAPALARQRRGGDDLGRRSATSCRSRPRPHSSPSTTSPDHGSWRHSSGSASTVSTCDSRQSVGPSPRPAQPRHEVGPRLRAPEQLDLEAGAGQQGRELLLQRRSSPGGFTVS
jgi:hypothetical protein